MAMSAQDVGNMFLGGVEEVGLDEILHSLRQDGSTEGCYVNVGSIDKLLDVFTSSGIHKTRPNVEIISAHHNSGASRLLYHIIAALTLPQTFNGCHIGGKGGSVVFLDTENNIDVESLAEIMTSYILKTFLGSDDDTGAAIERTLFNSLQHVHVFTPQSLADLQNTIECLPNYLFDHNMHHSSSRQLEAILLDSGSSFFWQDRMEIATTRFEVGKASLDKPVAHSNPPTEMKLGYQSLLRELRSVQNLFDCSVVATTWGLHPVGLSRLRAGNRRPHFRAHLNQSWNSFFALHLVVDHDSVPKFPPEMAINEALEDAAARQAASEAARFSAWLNLAGGEEWSDEMWRRLQIINEIHGFKF